MGIAHPDGRASWISALVNGEGRPPLRFVPTGDGGSCGFQKPERVQKQNMICPLDRGGFFKSRHDQNLAAKPQTQASDPRYSHVQPVQVTQQP
ncbi:hypothetical protein BRIN106911_22460 [Brevibacillus invocatus]